MEATGVYWKPVWHVLERRRLELLLVNPAHFKNLPGRKTDVKDSEWLAQLLECGLLRGSFVPPAEIAKLRDLTRYRTKIVGERVRETQRIQKLLEDAGIKLDSVATDVLGVSARRMLEALIAGERDPEVLADMALTRMRPKIGVLREALVGRFDDHHAVLLRMHLDHVDELVAIEARLDGEVNRLMAPFAEAATRLLSIPGVGKRSRRDHRRRDRHRHVPVPDRQAPGVVGRAVPRPSRVGRQTPLRQGPQGQPGAARRDVRSGVGGVARQGHLPRRPVPPVQAPLRHQGARPRPSSPWPTP